MKILLLLLAICSTAQAQVYATQEKNLTVIWRQTCPDLPSNAVYRPGMTASEYATLTAQYACINKYQSAQTPETLRQIKTALKNTGYKKKITIYSIDPIMRGKYAGDFDNDNVSYTFGAWVRKGKIYFSAMNECPNARRVLERVLRGLK